GRPVQTGRGTAGRSRIAARVTTGASGASGAPGASFAGAAPPGYRSTRAGVRTSIGTARTRPPGRLPVPAGARSQAGPAGESVTAGRVGAGAAPRGPGTGGRTRPA